MLGRKDYTRAELDHARAAIAVQLSAYDVLAASGRTALDDSEFGPIFFATLTLALDRYFVHRVRPVAGKDGGPLNEVELIVDSLMAGEVFRGNKVIKYQPARSVLGIEDGDRIRLSRDDFDRLSTAFFAELEEKFVTAGAR